MSRTWWLPTTDYTLTATIRKPVDFVRYQSVVGQIEKFWFGVS